MTPPSMPPPMPQPAAADRRARQVLPDAGDDPAATTAGQNGPGAAPSQAPWALASAGPVQRATARVRAKVRQLPGWDPLPPGDVDVRRSGAR